MSTHEISTLEQLEAATERDAQGRAKGVHVITANGDIILARNVGIAAGCLTGMKPGWQLATPEDIKVRAEANAAREAARGAHRHG
jgi:hypothetical protein